MTRKNFIKKIESNIDCEVIECFEQFDAQLGKSDFYAIIMDYSVDEDIWGRYNYYRVVYKLATMTEDFHAMTPVSREQAYDNVAHSMFWAVFNRMKKAAA